MGSRHVFLLLVIGVSVTAQGSEELSFSDRVRAQESMERVSFSHQRGTQRAFEQAVSRELLESKVTTYLKQTAALQDYWRTPITAEMLQHETERILRSTRAPGRLRELFAALGHDPVLVQETLVRQRLVQRLTRSFFDYDERIHGPSRLEAERLRDDLLLGAIDPEAAHPSRSLVEMMVDRGEPSRPGAFCLGAEEFARQRKRLPRAEKEIGEVVENRHAFSVSVILEGGEDRLLLAVYSVPKSTWEAWWGQNASQWSRLEIDPVASDRVELGVPRAGVPCLPDDTWETWHDPQGRSYHRAVWTGSLMLIWGGRVDSTGLSSGSRYDPVTDTWEPMSETGAPEARSEHEAVWTGAEMLVWGGLGNGTPSHLTSGGRYDPVTDTWSAMTDTNAPTPGRRDFAFTWTGSKFFIWGGTEFTSDLGNGGLYDPATDTWTATSSINAPTPRSWPTAVWSGTRVIVWGGVGPAGGLNTGALYNPATDSWTATTIDFAPSPRWNHGAVSTGTHMVVWGGFNGTNLATGARYDYSTLKWTPTSTSNAPTARSDVDLLWTGTAVLVPPLNATNAGGRYDPATDTWTAMSTVNQPPDSSGESNIWAGSRMIRWGGWNSGGINTGGRYDPATDSWTPTSVNILEPRDGHRSTWTGSLMVVWGGDGISGRAEGGGRYDPATDSWTPMSTVNEPNSRRGHSAVWTGDEILYWDGFGAPHGGARYDPAADNWSTVSLAGAPVQRWDHTAVWTGDEMVVWGGEFNTVSKSDGGRYDPQTDSWSPTSLVGAPPARADHTAVWTGKEMIVWGGDNDDLTGGLYDPSSDTWVATTLDGAPLARRWHTAVWAGKEMIIWGGRSGTTAQNSGGRYDPELDTWTPTTVSGAPAARISHSAVWTGKEMIIWGGFGSDYLGTGGRFDLDTDSWEPVATGDPPQPRTRHTAVWTGNQMIVWGGSNIDVLNSGGIYRWGFSRDDDGDSFSECTGDCDDLNVLTFPGAAELCDGIDQNCNMIIDDSAEPPEIDGVRFSEPVTLSWTAGPPGFGATHDIARGGLEFPVGSGSTQTCLGSESGDTSMVTGEPEAGSGYWYLVRGRNECGAGTWGRSSDSTERLPGVCP